MKLSGLYRHLLWAALAVGAAGAAHAASVVSDLSSFATDVRNYNLIALGNVNLTGSSEIHGAAAIKGSLTVGGDWSFASSNGTGTSDPSLYVNGAVSFTGTSQLINGTASTPNSTGYSFDSTSRDFYAGSNPSNETNALHLEPAGDTTSPHSIAAPTGWSWTSLTSPTTGLGEISTDLSSASATNVTVDAGGNLDLSTTQTSGIVVFDLDASQLASGTLSGLKNISINVPTGMNYVINVLNLSNNQTLFNGVNFNAGTNDDQVLWNFSETTNVTVQLGGNFYGSILAPNVNITDNTTIDGTVVANNFTDNGVELHDDDDFVDLNVPEPRTFALWAVALCGGMVLVVRRLRRPAKLAA
jgi:choice-of-anchor A domain-containing protein